MNNYEQLIGDFLKEYKEVSLDKIGTIRITGHTDEQTRSMPVEFIYNRKAVTSSELLNYIVQKTSKGKMLITSDLESHFAQAREFLNIGKTYEICNAGFIKKNNNGELTLIPASQAVKAQKNFSKSVQKKQPSKKAANSFVQLFTLLIVLAILSGLGWEAYQFFVKSKTNAATITEDNSPDSTANIVDSSHNKKDAATMSIKKPADTTKKPIVQQQPLYNQEDSADIKYVFEKTNLLLRAQTRTNKLISYNNEAGYDSIVNGIGKLYLLYILKRTKIADTLKIKDSIAKFLQKPVDIKIVKNK